MYHKISISGLVHRCLRSFPGGSDGKESARNARDPDLVLGSGRSPGKGNGYPLYYSCLENSMDRRSWWATVYGVTELDTIGQPIKTTMVDLKSC